MTEAKAGKVYLLEKVMLPEDKKSRAMNLGLVKGTELKVINLKKNGPMIIMARGTRLAVGTEYLSGIIVRELGR